MASTEDVPDGETGIAVEVFDAPLLGPHLFHGVRRSRGVEVALDQVAAGQGIDRPAVAVHQHRFVVDLLARHLGQGEEARSDLALAPEGQVAVDAGDGADHRMT
ncbi:hypothetical protein D3C72_2240370 [compost metagenome]